MFPRFSILIIMTRGAEYQPNREISAEFFQKLTLSDIFGKYPFKPGTRIITDFPYSTNLSDEQEEEILSRYGIPSIESFGNDALGSDGKARLVIYPGPTEKISWWVPQQSERELILTLAHRLVDQNRKPFIMDIGCGTGFLSKVIADEDSATVLGVDIDAATFNKLPTTQGDVTFRVANVWDILDEFGPSYPSALNQEVREDLQHLRRVLDKVTYPRKKDMNKEEYSEEKRKWFLAKRALKRRLQQNIHLYEAPSQVDMVINSFMDAGMELTIPIRDGIHPKCIVYVRGLSNEGVRTGVDRYREDYDESFIKRNLMVSYDPGEHFKTIAHWRTFSELDWGHHMYDQPSSVTLPVEVVVQLRKDVQIVSATDINFSAKKYPWDDELNNLLAKYGKNEMFFSGITQARNTMV